MTELLSDTTHFIFRFIYDFLIVTVLYKLIVGRFVAEKIMAFLTKESTRNRAIFQHYWDEARGLGHQKPVTQCIDGQCEVFSL